MYLVPVFYLNTSFWVFDPTMVLYKACVWWLAHA